MTAQRWRRTPDRKAGPANLLDDRFLVMQDGNTGRWHVLDRLSLTSYGDERTMALAKATAARVAAGLDFSSR